MELKSYICVVVLAAFLQFFIIAELHSPLNSNYHTENLLLKILPALANFNHLLDVIHNHRLNFCRYEFALLKKIHLFDKHFLNYLTKYTWAEILHTYPSVSRDLLLDIWLLLIVFTSRDCICKLYTTMLHFVIVLLFPVLKNHWNISFWEISIQKSFPLWHYYSECWGEGGEGIISIQIHEAGFPVNE